jgi:hypothetical protein
VYQITINASKVKVAFNVLLDFNLTPKFLINVLKSHHDNHVARFRWPLEKPLLGKYMDVINEQESAGLSRFVLCRTAKHMMFDILISIGQVLTLYGDDFLICRQVMSGHRIRKST